MLCIGYSTPTEQLGKFKRAEKQLDEMILYFNKYIEKMEQFRIVDVSEAEKTPVDEIVDGGECDEK
jgi:hypothetical protein